MRGDFLRLASTQLDNADKSHLLLMAEAWLDLADRIILRMKMLSATVDHLPW